MSAPLAAATLAALLLAAPLTAADSRQADVGPAHLAVDVNDIPSCAVEAAGLPCLLGYDNAGTPSPGDDTFYTYRSVEALRLAVDAPSPLPPFSRGFDLSDTFVEHPTVVLVDDAAVRVHGALHPMVRNRTVLVSYDTGTAMVVRGPGLHGTELGEAYYPVFVFFLPGSNRTGTRLLNGVAPYGYDTDATTIDSNAELLRLCFVPQLGGDDSLTCDALPAQAAAALAKQALPRVVLGTAVNRTAVHLGDDDAAPSALGMLSASVAPATPAEWVRGADPSVAERLSPAAWAPGLPRTDARPAEAAARIDPPPDLAPSSVATRGPEAPTWLLVAAALALAPLAALYQRLTRERCMRQANRARLLELARERPGLLLAEAAAELGIAYQSARHHVRILRRFGHLDVIKAGHNVVLFPSGSVPHALRQAIPRLQRGPLARTLLLVQQAPGSTASTVAVQAGTKRSSACARLGSLADLGLLQRDTQGACTISSLGIQALEVARKLEHPSRPAWPAAITAALPEPIARSPGAQSPPRLRCPE